MNRRNIFFILFFIITQSVYPDVSPSDSASVRFGIYAEFDGNINDLLGLRLKISDANTFIGQGSFRTSLFNNEDLYYGSTTRESSFNSYSLLLGYERRILSVSAVDCLILVAVQYSWDRTKQVEEVYHFDQWTNEKIVDRLAGTESKNTQYAGIVGIAAEYHITEQFSLELMKQFHYSRMTRYSTHAQSPSGSRRHVSYGVNDVLMNIIYYF